MYKCPVCKQASLTLWQYTVKTSFGSVVCSNCQTRLHSPPRARYALTAIPFSFLVVANHLKLLDSYSSAVFWIAGCALVSLAFGTWLIKLAPTSLR
jgi:hypothetical protein